MLQRIDKEANQRQLISNPLKITLLRSVPGISKALDLSGALINSCSSRIMTHYSQGACHLTERHIEANKIRTLLDIAEKTVKDLLDLGKIALNFFGHLPDQ